MLLDATRIQTVSAHSADRRPALAALNQVTAYMAHLLYPCTGHGCCHAYLLIAPLVESDQPNCSDMGRMVTLMAARSTEQIRATSALSPTTVYHCVVGCCCCCSAGASCCWLGPAAAAASCGEGAKGAASCLRGAGSCSGRTRCCPGSLRRMRTAGLADGSPGPPAAPHGGARRPQLPCCCLRRVLCLLAEHNTLGCAAEAGIGV